MPPISVVIADPDRRTRAACLRLLQGKKGINVVREVRGGLDSIDAAKLRPRIILLNLALSSGHTVAVLRVLRRRGRRSKVLLLTRGAPEALILDALSNGAHGYVEKKVLRTFLLKAVRRVDAGEAWVPRKMVAKIVERLACVTARRREVSMSRTRLAGHP